MTPPSPWNTVISVPGVAPLDLAFCGTSIICSEFPDAVRNVLGGAPYALVTSQGWVRRGAVESLVQACGGPVAAILDVSSHPTLEQICRMPALPSSLGTLVAVGGGSVIDAAKALAALAGCGNDVQRLRRFVTGREPVDIAVATRLIAVPTTAGTGSEVTPWATIWGGGEKYSLAHPDLSPVLAVLDPRMCSMMDADLALSSGLDAASHAMEAIWNRNHTPVSDVAASACLRVLRRELELPFRRGDLEAAARRQTAALYAGIAIRTTRTALAHSISYPLTAQFGLPHGLACSFTLGEVARFNQAEDPRRLDSIAECFECAVDAVPDAVNAWLRRTGIGRPVLAALGAQDLGRLAARLITPDRAGNNLRQASAADALDIVRRSLRTIQ